MTTDDDDGYKVLGIAVLIFSAMIAAGVGMMASNWIGETPAIGVGLIVFPIAFIVLARTT